MATSIAIEEESGTGSGRHPEHNGYYAGDFWSAARRHRPATAAAVGHVTPPSPRSGLGAGPYALVR